MPIVAVALNLVVGNTSYLICLFGTERRSKTSEGEVEEEFSMSAVDMSMIEHIPELIENGVDSF